MSPKYPIAIRAAEKTIPLTKDPPLNPLPRGSAVGAVVVVVLSGTGAAVVVVPGRAVDVTVGTGDPVVAGTPVVAGAVVEVI